MLVEQIWTGNAWRNFNYLIACPETGEALAIDPLEHQMCYNAAKNRGWEITNIVNTHEHGDHTGGNIGLKELSGAKIVMAHEAAKNKIPAMNKSLKAGDIIKIGKSIELEVLDTPGHTMAHVCLLSRGDTSALFSGDTLFNAGAGNCHNGGHPEKLYETFINQLNKLDLKTLIYPGHDYLENNLKFTLSIEPNNIKAKNLLLSLKEKKSGFLVTDFATEYEINTFFRLENKEIIDELIKKFGRLEKTVSKKDVFLMLRELRNSW